jgi:hypothetical protein
MATLTLETLKQQYKEMVTDGFKQAGLSLYEISELESYAKSYASDYIKLDEMENYIKEHEISENDLLQWGFESLKEDRMYKKREILESMENLAEEGEAIFTNNHFAHNPHDFNSYVSGLDEFSEVNNYDIELCAEVFMEFKEQIEAMYKQ